METYEKHVDTSHIDLVEFLELVDRRLGGEHAKRSDLASPVPRPSLVDRISK